MTRRTRKDQSGAPKTNLPHVPELDLVLYHWSPSTNRKSINRYGLMINQKTLQGDWRPPYVCLCDDPWLGWYLSGRMFPEIDSWDLWVCHDPSQTSFDHYEIITDTYATTGRHFVKEYRIYTRIYKRDLIYLATRARQEIEMNQFVCSLCLFIPKPDSPDNDDRLTIIGGEMVCGDHQGYITPISDARRNLFREAEAVQKQTKEKKKQ